MLSIVESVRKVTNETYMVGPRSFYIEYKYRELDPKDPAGDLRVYRFIDQQGEVEPFLFYVNTKNMVIHAERALSAVEMDVILAKNLLVSDLVRRKSSK